MRDALKKTEDIYRRKQREAWVGSAKTAEQYPAWMLKTDFFTERDKLDKRRTIRLGADFYEYLPQMVEHRAIGYCKSQWEENMKTKLMLQDTEGGIIVSMDRTEELLEGHIFSIKILSRFALFGNELEVGEQGRYCLSIQDTGYTMETDKTPGEGTLGEILQMVAQYDGEYSNENAVEIINRLQNFIRLKGISVERAFRECIEFQADQVPCRILWDGMRINVSVGR